jgi:membrane protease YdiL (CAAX protease family)
MASAAALVEEFGWTGFALPNLQRQHSALVSALTIGVVWGLWHFMGDFWGRAASYGPLYAPHFLTFIVEVTAYRTLMV